MKILDRNAAWPTEEVLNTDIGIYEKKPKHPKYLIMYASHEITRHTMLKGDKIICHPTHRSHFLAAIDSPMLIQRDYDGGPDRYCGMEIIWSTEHGLEVVSNGEI